MSRTVKRVIGGVASLLAAGLVAPPAHAQGAPGPIPAPHPAPGAAPVTPVNPASPPTTPPAEATAPVTVTGGSGATVTITAPVVDVAFAADLRESLSRPINVEMRDATVRQMAATLAQATSLSFRVDDSVPKDTRVTLEAHRVPAATVMDAVGRQANLVIAIDAERTPPGILLTRPAVLKVNGAEQAVAEEIATFPWSAEWGIPPSAALGLAAGYSAHARQLGRATIGAGTAGRSLPAGGAGYSGPAAGRAAQPFVNVNANVNVTPLAEDRFVVTEPGTGPGGERGVWLTLYQVQKDPPGTKRLGEATFHPLKPASTPTVPQQKR